MPILSDSPISNAVRALCDGQPLDRVLSAAAGKTPSTKHEAPTMRAPAPKPTKLVERVCPTCRGSGMIERPGGFFVACSCRSSVIPGGRR